MNYIFEGKPDKTFPDLINGCIYDLEVVVRNGKPTIKPVIRNRKRPTAAQIDKALLSVRERLDRADKHRRSLLYTLRHEEARENLVKFAYFLFFVALLYAIVILLCVPR